MGEFIMRILRRIQEIFNEIKNINVNSEIIELLNQKDREIRNEIEKYEFENISIITSLEDTNRSLNLEKEQLKKIINNLEEKYKSLNKENLDLVIEKEKILNKNTILERSYKELTQTIDQYRKNIEESKIKNKNNEINISNLNNLIEKLKKEKDGLNIRLNELNFSEKIKELYKDEEFKALFNLTNCKDYFEFTIKLNGCYNKSDFTNNIKKAYERDYNLEKIKNILEVYIKIEGLTFFEADFNENYDGEYFDSINEEKSASIIKKTIFPGIMKGEIVRQKSVVIIGD